jgi:hypothetical protein
MSYQTDRDAKKVERDTKRFQRAMATPVSRGEVIAIGEAQANHVMSIAIGIEALENVLVEAGILYDGELMERAKALAALKHEQAQIQVAQSQGDHNAS